MISGIYCIKNTANNRAYVGSAISLGRRRQEHLRDLKKGTHRNRKLQNAWLKYGEKAFEFLIIEIVKDAGLLIEREQFWIDEMKAASRDYGYNICSTAGNTLGYKHTPEHCAKLRESMLGDKNRNYGKHMPQEAREKNAAAHRGKIASEEARRKMSETRKGVPKTKEHARKIGDAHIGMKRSPEARARMSVGRIGLVTSEETRAKQSIAHRNITPETRAKMSASGKGKRTGKDNPMFGKKHSEETRAKISAAVRQSNNLRGAA